MKNYVISTEISCTGQFLHIRCFFSMYNFHCNDHLCWQWWQGTLTEWPMMMPTWFVICGCECPGPIHLLLIVAANLYLWNVMTKVYLTCIKWCYHVFSFDALASMIVNFPGLFPLFLPVNVNLCLFYLVAMQSLFSKQIMKLLLLSYVLYHTLRWQ